MLASIKKLFADSVAEGPASARESAELGTAVAGLLHEMMRVDLQVKPGELQVAADALAGILALPRGEACSILERTSEHRFTSYFGPVSIIKRLLSGQQRVHLVEKLWEVAFADGTLDPHEDHFVRKIAHLLYVSNTDAMLARQRARHASGQQT
jgi:uncharacterized tellurite resistance protein B-like protein